MKNLPGVSSRGFNERGISYDISCLEKGQAVLYGAEKLSGPAEPQILLGYFKTVVCGKHYFYSFPGLLGFKICQKHAVGFFAAAPNSSPELVKRRQAEAFGVLNNHYRGVGDIYADFNDGRGNKYVYFHVAEKQHYLFFFGRAHLPVQKAPPVIFKFA